MAKRVDRANFIESSPQIIEFQGGGIRIHFGTSLILWIVTCLSHASAEANPCYEALENTFDRMRSEKSRTDAHPDQIFAADYPRLAANTRVFVDARDLATLVPINKGQKIATFRVLGFAQGKLNLFSMQLGWIVLAAGHPARIYRRSHFARRSAFTKGEFVQLGLEANADLPLRRLPDNLSGSVSHSSLPWVAKFIRALDADHLEVEFPRVASGARIRYRVARAEVNRLRTGRAQILRAVLGTLGDPLVFTNRETVRFRDAHGLMQTGLVVGAESEVYQIQIRSRIETVKAADVFRSWTPGESHSVTFDASRLTNEMHFSIPLDVPRGFLLDVLNAAAKFTSHPEFLSASFLDQLNLLMEFQNIILPYTQAGGTLEATGVRTYSEILCAGTGLCRHNAPLMAAILSEAGLRTWVVHRIAETDETNYSAHAWVEVESSLGEVFVIDPSNQVVKSLADAEFIRSQDADSLEAKWWAHPARERLKPELALPRDRDPLR